MCMTDTVADMLTRIRNANMTGQESVDIPLSHFKVAIAKVLKTEGFIKEFKEIPDERQGNLRVYLKYGPMKHRVITEIRRDSKSGRRLYKKAGEIKSVLGGIGVAIYSTPRGVISNKEAKRLHVGGELICTLW
ncbi:MAG TPA: 30S ribosomal protein S8 [Candidatus Brocadiales bacterium]|nr:30S ribosomal protein S8 [Candidatus Brocadiales bacterium]